MLRPDLPYFIRVDSTANAADLKLWHQSKIFEMLVLSVARKAGYCALQRLGSALVTCVVRVCRVSAEVIVITESENRTILKKKSVCYSRVLHRKSMKIYGQLADRIVL